jgi:hypothetical protein
MEFITLAVSNSDELRSHWFGSNSGEEFYQTYSNLSDAIIPFRCFSILKKKGMYYNHSNILALAFLPFDK